MAPKTSTKSKTETAAAPELWCAIAVNDDGELDYADPPLFKWNRTDLMGASMLSFPEGAVFRVFRLINEGDYELMLVAKRKGA